jgi:hypothetical protein
MLPQVLLSVVIQNNILSCTWLSFLLGFQWVRFLVELSEGFCCCSVRLNILDMLIRRDALVLDNDVT